MFIDTTEQRGSRQQNVKHVKILWASHHAYFESNLIPDIATACKVGEAKIRKWVLTPEWKEACQFWGYTGEEPLRVYDSTWQRFQHDRMNRSFAAAEERWKYMIQNGLDLFPSGLEKDPVLERFYGETFTHNRTGIEVMTPWARFRDFLMTARYRLTDRFWQVYLHIFL